MELRQLEYFVAVCEELHFTRAAEKLRISQPSLSQQIRLIEHEAGMPLFDRIGKKISITEAGSILLKHCYNVFHELEQAQAALNELQGLKRGTLKIGALHSVMNQLLPSAIKNFHAHYPQIELALSGLRHGEIIEKLLHNELDIGIVYLPVEHEELHVAHLYDEALALAVHKDNELAGLSEIKLASLQDVPMVMLQNPYRLRQFLDGLFREHRICPKTVMELNALDAMISMVDAGAGAAILPLSYLQRLKQPAIRIIPIADPVLSVQIGIAYRRNKYLCAASKVFIEHISASVTPQL
ncbi:LysR substrate-binding domain-containing protein [Paenibacillus glycanilyticus]|uniref:LysR family transcriptional regulator n=1 Tax=Paenibacillus glycanilyticus TaxID=126569 RepID=UPI00203A397E|nr:LysR substrate-binding domain-containing protein [Paenibacillus glycanilyticus]MCM3627749.1 LysR substrate-binding domain-containing protein [Paenibacillus glycanilyticus]